MSSRRQNKKMNTSNISIEFVESVEQPLLIYRPPYPRCNNMELNSPRRKNQAPCRQLNTNELKRDEQGVGG